MMMYDNKRYMNWAMVIALVIIFISVSGNLSITDKLAVTILNVDGNLKDYVQELSVKSQSYTTNLDWLFPIIIILSHLYFFVWLYVVVILDQLNLGMITGFFMLLLIILLFHGAYFVIFDDGQITTTVSGIWQFTKDMFPGNGVLYLLSNIDELKNNVDLTESMINQTNSTMNNITLDMS